MQGVFYLNILELISAKIKVYITLKVLQVDNMEGGIKMQWFTDRSSALVWMHHSTFNPIRDKAHDEVENILARYMTDFKSSFIHKQTKWDNNDLVDSLSRYCNISPPKITQLLYKLLQTQVPKNLNILELPKEWISRIQSLRAWLPVTRPSPQPRVTSKKLGSIVSLDSLRNASLRGNPSSPNSSEVSIMQ